MKKFIGYSIQEALRLASHEFACSIDELEYEVVVPSRKGILGLWKQDAVILAQKMQQQVQESHSEKKTHYTQIEENFFQEENQENPQLAQQIGAEIDALLSFLPYEIDAVQTRIEKDSYLDLEITGKDCGLLIGEKGYRYNAIYYLLSIWIKKEYGLGLRLEVADFLKNKEKRIEAYLQEHYDTIISRTSFQSRAFDPLMAGIALRRFREAIPNKYIVAKQISEFESVIVVNEFRTK